MRLKGVHVLNTATWIHHVMRLIIPLVKSEIMGLVKFHRGNCTCWIYFFLVLIDRRSNKRDDNPR